MNDEKYVILFCHSSTERLGEEISELSKNEPSKTKIVLQKDVSWKKFSDGFPNLFIQNLDKCKSKHVAYLGSFHTPENVFEQISLVYSLTRYSIRSLTFVLPYFPTGTMERVDEEGQVATAMSMARILSAIPLSMMGPTRLMIYDIHSLQERFYFSDNVLPQMCSAVPNLVAILRKEREAVPLSIAFPDEGAHKRFHRYFTEFPIVRCTKVRDGTSRKVTIVEGDPTNRHVVIVDDLVMSGGTILECIGVLFKAGAVKVSAYVTHPVFPLESWKIFTEPKKSPKLSTFWITNSIPHAYDICKRPPFKLLSLAGGIKELLENGTY